MSEPRNKYHLTLTELHRSCQLLASVTVGEPEALIGRNHAGEIVVRVNGKITPAKVKDFQNAYQFAVAKGLIKARPQGEQHG